MATAMASSAPLAVVQQSLPFDQRHVFDRLPLSEDQKLALLQQLLTEKKEIADQCRTETLDSVRTGDACAAAGHHPDRRETAASSSHQD